MGSIPAPTGKPRQAHRLPTRSEVYPRAYGEAEPRRRFLFCPSGLSPRLRGSRPVTTPPGAYSRSIPAPTGKPLYRTVPFGLLQVYPRAYGEARVLMQGDPTKGGLSPRLRGSPAISRSMLSWERSIPAPTGKPRGL